MRADYLKEAFQLFWDYKQPGRVEQHLHKCMNSATGSRLEPFQAFVRMLRSHLAGSSLGPSSASPTAPWKVTNKIKLVSHRSFGLRSVANFTATIYHYCARLPLPVES